MRPHTFCELSCQLGRRNRYEPPLLITRDKTKSNGFSHFGRNIVSTMSKTPEDTSAPEGPERIELKTCAVGGHMLGRGCAVQKELAKEYPNAKIEHTKGHMFQFSVKKDDEEVVGNSFCDGFTTLGRMMLCCGSPKRVADRVKSAGSGAKDVAEKEPEKEPEDDAEKDPEKE